MSAIKFRKRLTKFEITIVLPKKFGSKVLLRKLKSLRFEEALANLISCMPHMRYAGGPPTHQLMNCKRETAMGMTVEKITGALNQFYSHLTSSLNLMQLQI